MDKELIMVVGSALLMSLLSFIMGLAIGAGEVVEINNGCHVYNNELYCPIYTSVDSVEVIM